MSRKIALFALALLSGYSASAMAYEFGPSSMFSVNGFGTLGAVHSNLERADYTAIYLQPDGAGFNHKWSPEVDSVFGLQGAAKYNKWKVVVQAVTKQNAFDNWHPHVEWANLNYAFTDRFSARFGRFAMPTYLFSDTRLVRYAMTAVRPSVEVYRLLPITTLDGVDLTYKFNTGPLSHAVRTIYGKNTTQLSATTYSRNTDNIAIVDDMEVGDFTIHTALQRRKFMVVLPTSVSNWQRYKVADIAVNYDNGKQFAMVEFVHTWLEHPELSATSIGYVINVGQRFEKFTPYIQYGKLDPLINLLTFTRSQAPASNTKTVGLRWDFRTNYALKAQYDRAEAENDGRGTYVNGQVGFPVNSSTDVISVALDFVF